MGEQTVAFRRRALTRSEAEGLVALLDDCGPGAILDAVGRYLANEIADFDQATGLGSRVRQLGRKAQAEPVRTRGNTR